MGSKSLRYIATYVAVSRAHRACRGPDRVHPTRANVTDQHVQSATSDEAGERSYLPKPQAKTELTLPSHQETSRPESSIVWPPLCCWRAAVAQRACNALPTCTAAARAACGDCEARDLGRELRPRDYMQRTWRLSAPLPANSCRPRPSAPHHARVHTAGHRRVSPAQTTTPAHQRFPL